jgi:hypothetical protein
MVTKPLIAAPGRNAGRLLTSRSPLVVIPGSPEGRGPESMNTGLWNMDSGLAAARRPGMTIWVV